MGIHRRNPHLDGPGASGPGCAGRRSQAIERAEGGIAGMSSRIAQPRPRPVPRPQRGG
jgi:hypothetical protein